MRTSKSNSEGCKERHSIRKPYYKPIMENISAGTGIPETILRGAQAGVLTGSEVNEREYFKMISSIQVRFEPLIRWLIDRLIAGGQVKAEEYVVRWVPVMQPSAKDEAATELMRQQANNLRCSYLTIDEVRALEGRDPLPEGQGTVTNRSSAVPKPNQ